MFHHVTLQELSGPLAERITDATLFGSPRWLTIWEALGGSPLIFQSSSENQLTNNVAFSALSFGSSLLSRIQAQVDGLPAIMVTENRSGSEVDLKQIGSEVRNPILQTLRNASGLYAHWVDYFNLFDEISLPPGWELHQRETLRIALGAERISPAESVKRHIKSGKKNGATIRAANSEADALATYDLSVQTHERYQRSRTYPLELYLKLLDLAEVDERIMWFICEHEGKVIGAHIALQERDTVISWAPYMNRESSSLKPAYLLMDEVISAATERKASFLDLGMTPTASTGVKDFKMRFGAQPYRYQVFVYRSILARVLGKGGLK